MNLAAIFTVIALVLCALAAFGYPSRDPNARLHLGWLGVAFYAAASLVR